MTTAPLYTEWYELLNTKRTGNMKGDCYSNTARFVLDKGEDAQFLETPLVLCHGDVRAANGTYHGHAWVEWGDGYPLVLDPSNGTPLCTTIPSQTYYELGGIDQRKVVRFTVEGLRQMVLFYKTYGPWEVVK